MKIQEVLKLPMGTRVKSKDPDIIWRIKGFYDAHNNVTKDLIKIDTEGILSSNLYTGTILEMDFEVVEDNKKVEEEYPLTMDDVEKYPAGTTFISSDGVKYEVKRYCDNHHLIDEDDNEIYESYSFSELMKLKFKIAYHPLFSIENILDNYGSDTIVLLREGADGPYLPLKIVLKNITEQNYEKDIIKALKEEKYRIQFGGKDYE